MNENNENRNEEVKNEVAVTDNKVTLVDGFIMTGFLGCTLFTIGCAIKWGIDKWNGRKKNKKEEELKLVLDENDVDDILE